ncbi:hypothetical protein OSCT_0314 [Oscillochloris trichoides DG-6]|uniref:Uncharacterized protein n=1 Tax=Oscillochloris trichoides DG-6 TaxID=765420 RepID=E1IAG3_9CHLR|nr:hypothetical protein OSCT_0314 [Oscillochloris trichoides DG-6]
MFQSAGRIWGFWNEIHPLPTGEIVEGFNPPGGFGAFGTAEKDQARDHERSFNPPGGFGAFGTPRQYQYPVAVNLVSIRRADLGLLERSIWAIAACSASVSIRRADLGLLEH